MYKCQGLATLFDGQLVSLHVRDRFVMEVNH